MSWYYDQSGKSQGPISAEELDALLARGTIQPGTLVWTEGMANWTPISVARPASGGEAAGGQPMSAGPQQPPAGWIRCSATGQYFPPEEIVYIDGKPYSA